MTPQYNVTYVDQWGAIYVECPACGLPYKSDGVVEHIRRMAWNNASQPHLEWYRRHGHLYSRRKKLTITVVTSSSLNKAIEK